MMLKRERRLRPLPDCLRQLTSATLHGMNDSLTPVGNSLMAPVASAPLTNSVASALLTNSLASAFRRKLFSRRATLLLPIALTVVLAACTKTAAQQAAPPPAQVTVANVIERDVTDWDEFTGRLQAVESVDVRPRVSGLVSAVRFSEGAMVRKGDLLFQIDPRPFQAEVDRLQAELDRARATVRRANSELERAERLRRENAISNEEHDRRAAFAQESAAQVARSRPRCARRS